MSTKMGSIYIIMHFLHQHLIKTPQIRCTNYKTAGLGYVLTNSSPCTTICLNQYPTYDNIISILQFLVNQTQPIQLYKQRLG